nr:hypothetical protein [Staphylococcus arlettae]
MKVGIIKKSAKTLLSVPTENIPNNEVIKKLIQKGCQKSERDALPLTSKKRVQNAV